MQLLLSALGSEGATKTQMMNRASLISAQLKEYVLLLAENDLLEHDVDNRMYKTTEKDKKFINTYNKMQDYVKMLEG